MILRRLLLTCVMTLTMLATVVGMGDSPVPIARAQADPCGGLPAWSQAMLAEEQRYTDQITTTLDLNDLQAIAAATPEQLTAVVEIIDRHLKNLDAIEAPAFAENWQMALAESGDLTQALFADGALNGIFSILVDYYDQSVRSDEEIAQAREAATAACPDFDAFATQFDLVDGEADSPAPGYAPWSTCAGLDDLGVAMGRANLQGLLDVPAAAHPLAEFAADFDVDPSIQWNQLEFFSLADYYESVASHLEQITPPDYAAAWLQATIDFYRAIADIVRGAHGQGILQASATSGADVTSTDQALTDGITSATQTCSQFPQFADEN
jgi:hypothetical protein